MTAESTQYKEYSDNLHKNITIMTNITTGSVLSANVRVNNFSDITKTFDITCDIAIVNNPSDYGDGQIQNGSVSFDGKTLAVWSRQGNLSIQYYVEDAIAQARILAEVQQFIEKVQQFRADVVLTAGTSAHAEGTVAETEGEAEGTVVETNGGYLQ